VALPAQIADNVGFLFIECDGEQHQLVDGGDVNESITDIHFRSDPLNASDPADRTTWIFLGDSTRTTYPLKADQSLNIRVTRRTGITYKGPKGHVLHVVTTKVSKSIPPGSTMEF
jgi:hypothetical protein